MIKTQGINVGELAKRTGVSVRTLHYYDEIGLLRPSMHTEAMHRLYGEADVARLQQIKSLQQLGFSLEEVAGLLDREEWSLLEVVRLHLQRLEERIAQEERLRHRLRLLEQCLGSTGAVPVEDYFSILEGISQMEKYYTPEQMKQLEERRRQVGDERIREVEAEWPRLMEEVRQEMEKGTDPGDPKVQALAERWEALIKEFSGGDQGLEQSAKKFWEDQPAGRDVRGIKHDPALFEYVGKAMALRQ